MAFGESAGLLFRIKGDESDALRAFKNTEDAAKGTASSLSSLAGPAAIAATGVTVIATAALATTAKLFDLSKQAAEYGSAIFDATQKTGQSAETMSALQFAAEQSGSSFEAVTNSVSKFTVLLGQSQQGNEKARATLAQYGITATETDKALEQAIARIASFKNPAEQAAAATALFKDRTGQILPVIKSFDGNLPALMDKLRGMGLLLSTEDAKAADEFGDQIDQLNKQMDAVTRQIGFAFMPVFLDMAKSISNFVKNNQADIRQIANNVSLTIQGTISEFKDLKKAADDYYFSASIQALLRYDPLARTVAALGQRARTRASADNAISSGKLRSDFTYDPTAGEDQKKPGGAETEDAAEKAARQREAEQKRREAERAREAARKKAEALEDRDLAAQIRIEAINLKTVQEGMQSAYDALRNTLSQGGAVGQFTANTNEATRQWADNLNRSLTYIEEIEKRALAKDATENERAELQQKQQQRRHELKLQQDEEIKKNEDLAWQIRLERGEQEAALQQTLFEAEQKRRDAEYDWLTKTLPELQPAPLLQPEQDSPSIFDEWSRSWEDFFNLINEQAPTLQDVLTNTASILQNAFQGVANAIGNVIQNWVLYGNTGPGVMRKILAAALASIAAEAAVQAIFELAKGFASLFFNPAEAAAHFTAAALYGSIAGVAALAGRAIAGNSFRQQSQAATGSSRSSSTSRSSGGSGAYSSYGNDPKIVEQGRNSPLQANVVLKVEDKSDGFANMFKLSIERNSAIRSLIKEVAEA